MDTNTALQKRIYLHTLLEKLVHCRFNKETLEQRLSEIFGEKITIELGCEDVDYLTDWNYMFTSEKPIIGGDFDIHVLMHKNCRQGFDGATFMITEINCEFFDIL